MADQGEFGQEQQWSATVIRARTMREAGGRRQLAGSYRCRAHGDPSTLCVCVLTDTRTSHFGQRRYCLCLLIAGILAAVLTPVLIKLFRK